MKRESIKGIFKLDLSIKSFFLFLILSVLVISHKILSDFALQDIVSFKSYLSNLVQTDIYMALIFVFFWMLIYLGILFIGAVINPLNFLASILLVVSIFIHNWFGSLLIPLSWVVVLIGIIIFVVDSIKKRKENRK